MSTVSVSKAALRAAERDALLRKKKTERRRGKRNDKREEVPVRANHSSNSENADEEEYEIEYIPETIGEEYADLMAKFAPKSGEATGEGQPGSTEYSAGMSDIFGVDSLRRAAEAAAAAILEMSTAQMSNKEKRLAGRMSIAALKAAVDRPDLVDGMDNCSPDPLTLLFCKGYKNAVQVPRHWSTKRNYMAAKRGIDKPPFKLPEYVEQTGIAKIRQAVLAKEAERDIKAKQRAKMRPKTGKLDIDYQVLHNAFFKYQTKPAFLTKFGDIYFEGRENETRYVHKKPGHISAALREALGMLELTPPPWLVSMQRFGPPAAYPNLKIPGLNAPIPMGADWGYHPGGWGKPPVDQFGNPMYGGAWNPETDRAELVDLEAISGNKNLWGEFQDEEDSEDEDDIVQDAPIEVRAVAPTAPIVPKYNPGVAATQLPQKSTAPTAAVPAGAALYKVLPQRSAPTQPGALFPSRAIYEVAPVGTASGIAQRASEVEAENVLTAEMIKQQLAAHEAAEVKKPPKKKSKFKF